MDIQLEKFIERLVKRIDIERIYQFAFPTDDGEQQLKTQLLLVVNPVKGMAPNALAPIVSLCMSDLEKEIPFEMMITGEWSNRVKQGSLYHTYASLPEHLRYASKNRPNTLFPDKNIKGLLELAQYEYNRAREISDEFRAGVANFLAKDDYTQATFMLHQFVETRIKAFKTSVAGVKSTKGHNLEQLIKSIRGTLPGLHDLFPYDELQAELLRKLDQSYVKTLKWLQIEITKEEFDVLLQKCEGAAEEMDRRVALMFSCITAYREKKSVAQEKAAQDQVENKEAKAESYGSKQEGQPVKTLVCESFKDYPWLPEYTSDVNQLLEKIRKNHNPEQITMLNYHTGGFSGGSLFQQEQQDQQEQGGAKVELYLVVIMNNTGPFHFKCMQVGVASAMVLYLNVSYIERKLAEGHRFVNTLWTRGRILRRKSTFKPKFDITEVDWEAIYEKEAKIVENAKVCMNNLYCMLNNSSTLMLDTALLLIRNLYEIGVNTYTRCTLGSRFLECSLGEQVDWSGAIDRKLIDFVYPDSEVQLARLRLIMGIRTVWWKCVDLGLSKTSKPEYTELAREVKHFFEKQLDKTLVQLKQRAEQKKKEAISD
ncbi:HEPN domain-containing protein [Sphingobacterium olei]|uniref:HEPN domain-containing protein n=1 Tax=Sphingobacterium olei TaxID=2571155 RepID=A0A4U0P0A3_9SPHI|nr:HEPN domain-containing protein [Sphingobacterium olei]TJZ60627.1 HEPN domain-containing protein [Sphingobacterium olei]